MSVLGFEPRSPRIVGFGGLRHLITGVGETFILPTSLERPGFPNIPQRDVLTTALYRPGRYLACCFQAFGLFEALFCLLDREYA